MGRGVQVAILVLLFAGAHRAQASTIQFYDTESDWLAAATGITTFDFSAFANPAHDMFYGTLSTNGVTFTGAGNYLWVRDGSPGFMYGPPGGGIAVVLPSGTTAVGWSGGSFYGNPVAVDINGDTYAGLSAGFFGFTSTNPITSLVIRSDGYPTITSFSFGSATVPDEGSTLFLLGIGLTVVGVLQSRRRGLVRT